MSVYKPSELKQLLLELGVSPKKGLSQNFLIDGNILNKIVDLAEVKENDSVLEIGPGPGALTEFLLERKVNLIAVEKDSLWADRLKNQFPQVKVFNEDILDFDFDKHIPPGTKVVANLPYHITTPIISKIIQRKNLFSLVIVMVQEEVGRRMTAEKNTKDYGSLSVFINYFSRPTYGFKVKRTSFLPAPKVDSAVVKLEIRTPPRVSNEETFFKMVREAFNHRRKMLRGSLSKLYSREALERALPYPEARPENLDLGELIALFEAVKDEIAANENDR